ncbi:hypothetical protein GCM10010493_17590 [Streptomyces lavendulae subsp. grasserius]
MAVTEDSCRAAAAVGVGPFHPHRGDGAGDQPRCPFSGPLESDRERVRLLLWYDGTPEGRPGRGAGGARAGRARGRGRGRGQGVARGGGRGGAGQRNYVIPGAGESVARNGADRDLSTLTLPQSPIKSDNIG